MDIANGDFSTSLHMAGIRGYTEMALDFINAGAETDLLDKDFRTPLDWARARGYIEIVQALTKATMDTKFASFNKDSKTSLHIALKKGHTQVAQIFINGANIEIEQIFQEGPKSSDCYTPSSYKYGSYI